MEFEEIPYSVLLVFGMGVLIIFAAYTIQSLGTTYSTTTASTQNLLGPNGTTVFFNNNFISLASVSDYSETWLTFNATKTSSVAYGDSVFTVNSVSIWLYPQDDNDVGILYGGVDAYDGNGWNWSIFGSDEKIYLSPGSGATGYNESIVKDVWVHYVMVRNNGTAALIYKNGALVATKANATNNAALRFGKSGAEYYTGNADELRIYDIALTAAQVSAINSAGRTPNATLPSSGLIIWNSMNENNGTVLHNLANAVNTANLTRANYTNTGVLNSLSASNYFTNSSTLTLTNPSYAWDLLFVTENDAPTTSDDANDLANQYINVVSLIGVLLSVVLIGGVIYLLVSRVGRNV